MCSSCASDTSCKTPTQKTKLQVARAATVFCQKFKSFEKVKCSFRRILTSIQINRSSAGSKHEPVVLTLFGVRPPTAAMSYNTFGVLFRVTTFGESHGPAIGCVVDGCPPRIALTEADIQPYLDKRRPGQSRFTTQRQEPDAVRILSGVFVDETSGQQVTTGTPIALVIDNVDQRSKDYSDIKDKYRPGHADYTYDVKYGLRDYRGGGRQSARETAPRVAGGASARQNLARDAGARRAGANGPAPHRSRQVGLGRSRAQRVLLSGCGQGCVLCRLSRWCAQNRLVGGHGERDHSRRRAGGAGRADLRQARRRSGRSADGHQRGQGRRDRRRLWRR